MVPTASIAVSPLSVLEDGATNLVYTVTLDHASAFDTTMNYSVGGTATEGTDYTGTSTHSITILAGQTSGTITVDPTADTTFENNETVILTLTGGTTNAQPINLGTAAATGTIINDDAVPTASIAVSPLSVLEDGATNLVYTVTLDHASAFDTTVNYSVSGTATEGTDYTGTSTHSITILAGQTSGTITVDPTADTTFENNETVTVTLTGGATATGTITNDDAVPTASIAVSPLSVLEDGATNLVYTVTLDHASAFDTTVNYSVSGTATEGTDYTGTSTHSITILAGQTSGTITVDPTADTTFENNETVTVTLTGGTTNAQPINLGTAAATGTIINDDAVPTASIAVSPLSVLEDGATNLVYTVTLDHASAFDTTVNYSVSGTATEGTDYTGTSTHSITILAGQTSGTITVDPTADTTFENNETVTVTLTGGATATGTITNDDAVPTASIAVSPLSVLEDGATNLVYTVTLDHASAFDTTMNYSVGGTATEGTDYTGTSTHSITILAGQTSGTITVDPTADTTFENDETVTVTLTGGTTNAQPINLGTAAATGTIINDDAVPTASIAVSPLSVLEDGATNLVYTVTLDHASAFDTTVNYSVSGTATEGTDYTGTSTHSITILAGQTSGTITVDPTADTTFENNETVTVTLTGGATATGTITNDDAVPTASIAVSPLSVLEDGATNLVYTVTLDHASAFDTTVNYSVSGTATEGTDYTGTSTHSITILAGQTSGTITVDPTADTTFENNETVTVTLTGGTTNAQPINLGTAAATGTIINDDAVPTASIAVSPLSVLEDGATNLVYTVTLDHASAFDTTVNYSVSGTATEGTDYTGTSTHSITILAGQTSGTITVDPTADTTFENNETVTVTLTGGTTNAQPINLGTAAATGTIINDDGVPTASIAVSPLSVLEDGSTNLVYTVTLDHASAFDTTVNYSVSGTATEGTDYTGTSTHSITILAGQTSGTITVDPTADTTFENNETVTVTLTGGATATGTITNDDAVPTASIAVSPLSVLEDGATNLVYTVTLDHASAFDTTVNYSVSGTATEGTDYTGTSTHSITILAGQTSGTITVDPTADTTFENNETVTVTLTGGTTNAQPINLGTAAATGTIINDDAVPTASIAVSPLSVLEDGATNLVYTVTLDHASAFDTTVNYSVSGTATEGTDYTGTSTHSITILAGQTSGTITVDPTADTTFENNETVILTLTGGTTNAQPINLGTAAATGTIINDDAVPTASIAVSPLSVLEDGATNLVYTVTLDHASAFDTTVNYSVSGTATEGTDYTGTSTHSITILAGQTSGTITVDPTADTTFENNETVTVTLTGGATATGTITNDDAVPTASIAVAPASVLEDGATNLVYTVTLDHASAFDTTMNYSVGGTATEGTDYTGTSTHSITILAGQTSGTITVDPTADTTFENDETVTVTLTGGTTNAQPINLGTAAATGTITNDDAMPAVVTGVSYTLQNAVPGQNEIDHNVGNASGTALIDIHFSQSVSVTGTPTLTLNIGSSLGDFATYVSGSGSQDLIFSFTPSNSGNEKTTALAITSVNGTINVTGTSTPANTSGADVTLSPHLGVNEPPAPAGTAGDPINLALADPPSVADSLISITFSGVPLDWHLNYGTDLGNGVWSVQTNDVSTLTVTTPSNYTGAVLLHANEEWTATDGTRVSAIFGDNVEAYASGSPIFAWSGSDTLTGTGANDLFVFSSPISNDDIYNFNSASDKIDLIGFGGISSFADLHIVDNSVGEATIDLGDEQTITLHGVDAASLTSSDFLFDQRPTVDNAGLMVISDGAMLPLSGDIDNTGTIELELDNKRHAPTNHSVRHHPARRRPDDAVG